MSTDGNRVRHTFAAWSRFRHHIAKHAPETFVLGVINEVPHQQSSEPVALEALTHQDRKFRRLFVEFAFQAHQPQHVTTARSFPVLDRDCCLVRIISREDITRALEDSTHQT